MRKRGPGAGGTGVLGTLSELVGAAGPPLLVLAWAQQFGLIFGDAGVGGAVLLALLALAFLPAVALAARGRGSAPSVARAARIELAIGACGPLTLWLLKTVDGAPAISERDAARFLLCGAAVLPAATLLALRLPARQDGRGSLLGWLLGTAAGAAAGVLLVAGAGSTPAALAGALLHLAAACLALPARGVPAGHADGRAETVSAAGGTPPRRRALPAWVLGHAAMLLLAGWTAGSHWSLVEERVTTEPPMAGEARAERQLGLVPGLLCRSPRRVAVLGLGNGIAASRFAALGEVREIDCVEPSDAVIAGARWYRDLNHDVLKDRRLSLIRRDPRAFIRASRASYDLILAQTSRPRAASAGGLLTREHFQSCAARLTGDGLMAQWLAAGALSGRELDRVIATFRSVFPDATLWQPGDEGTLLLVGSRGGARVGAAEIARRVRENPRVAADYRSHGWKHPLAFLSLHALGPDELQALAPGRELLTDSRPLVGTPGLLQSMLKLESPAHAGDLDAGLAEWGAALQRLRGGDLPAVIAYTADPRRDPRYHLSLAAGYERAGELERAGMALEEALRLDPELAAARAQLARLAARLDARPAGTDQPQKR